MKAQSLALSFLLTLALFLGSAVPSLAQALPFAAHQPVANPLAGLNTAELAGILEQVIDSRPAAPQTVQQAYLKASNAESLDLLGVSVAISGDTLVVGAPAEDSSAAGGQGDNSAPGAGAVYVFVRSGSTWSQQAYLKASNAEPGDGFGASVAISGDTLVVGAWGEDSSAAGGEGDNSTLDAGAAYVFVRSGITWSQQAILKASNAGAYDSFGWSVALSGSTAVVGAYAEDGIAGGLPGDNAGAAYVFIRSGTSWSQQAFLKASNADAGDSFGWSVAISGETLVVGAWGEDSRATGGPGDNFAESVGAAYVFTRSGVAWSQQAYLKASNADAEDFFGWAVSISGDNLVVGAPYEDSSAAGGPANNSLPGAGAAYVFTRSGTAWSQRAYLKASNAGSGDNLGNSVAIFGNNLLVGAYLEDSSAAGGPGDNSASDAGAAYVFIYGGTGWKQFAFLKAANAGGDDRFGYSVALSGGDLVVGAYHEDSNAAGGPGDNSASDAGAVYISPAPRHIYLPLVRK